MTLESGLIANPGNLRKNSAEKILAEDLINDPEPAVRIAATLALSKMGHHAEYVPFIAEYIESENLITGMYAIRALEQIGAPSKAVLPAIEKARDSPYEFTRRIARRLVVQFEE